MTNRTGILGFFVLAFSAVASATTVTWTMSANNMDLGTSHSFTSNTGGITITAYGFTSPTHNDAQLYGKNLPTDDVGLGLDLENDAPHEVTGSSFVQFDLTNLINAHAIDLMFSMTSVTGTDAWKVLGSSTFGTPGTSAGCTPACPAGMDELTHGILAPLPHFLTFAATGGTYLIHTLSADIPDHSGVPEPASLALMGMGLLGLGAFGRRFRKSR